MSVVKLPGLFNKMVMRGSAINRCSLYNRCAATNLDEHGTSKVGLR